MSKWVQLEKSEIEYLLKTIEQIQTKVSNKLTKKLRKFLQPIKISSRKGKGRRLQYWVCKRLADILQIEFNQQDDQCDIHSREMGQSGTDVILRGKAFERLLYSIECKSGESINLLKAIEQAKQNNKEKMNWLLIHKRKQYKKPIVIMDWETFEKLERIRHVRID